MFDAFVFYGANIHIYGAQKMTDNTPYITDSEETEARKKKVLADYYKAFPEDSKNGRN